LLYKQIKNKCLENKTKSEQVLKRFKTWGEIWLMNHSPLLKKKYG